MVSTVFVREMRVCQIVGLACVEVGVRMRTTNQPPLLQWVHTSSPPFSGHQQVYCHVGLPADKGKDTPEDQSHRPCGAVEVSQAWVWIPALLLLGCVTSGKSPHLSVSWIPHL